MQAFCDFLQLNDLHFKKTKTHHIKHLYKNDVKNAPEL